MKIVGLVKSLVFVCSTAASSLSFAGHVDRTKSESAMANPVFVQIHPLKRGLGVEVGVSDLARVGLEGSFDGEFGADNKSRELDGKVGLSASYYLTDTLSDSGYFKALGSYGRKSVQEFEAEGKDLKTELSLTGLVGYQMVVKNGVLLNAGAGAIATRHAAKEPAAADTQYTLASVKPTFEMAVGFNF